MFYSLVKVKSSLTPLRLQRWVISYSAQSSFWAPLTIYPLLISRARNFTITTLLPFTLSSSLPPRLAVQAHTVLLASCLCIGSSLCLRCLAFIQIIHTCPWRLSLDNFYMASSPRQPHCFSPGWSGGIWFTAQSMGMALWGDVMYSLHDRIWSAHTLPTSPPLLCPPEAL